ncbi:replication-relaxation family protein [Streptomyces acidicola]|uniref:replication-relaxation family protein n=1 Tax=Streptomyces acidicola TaxID=2596892 RepID=UPI0037F4A91C
MTTTKQMHRVIAPGVRIEQTRRRLARLRTEGLVDRITLPQAGRTRVWFPTSYGMQLASEWPEMRGHRPSRTVSDPTAVRLKAGHKLTVTVLVFPEDGRRRGELCRPLDWICEVHHPIGSGEAVIPDALLYYRHGLADGSMLRAFVEVGRATMGPERLAAKLTSYERLHRYVPTVPGRRPILQEPTPEEWRRHYPLFPRVLFVLDSTGPAGVENRISALRAGAESGLDELHDAGVPGSTASSGSSPTAATSAGRTCAGPPARAAFTGARWAGLPARPPSPIPERQPLASAPGLLVQAVQHRLCDRQFLPLGLDLLELLGQLLGDGFQFAPAGGDPLPLLNSRTLPRFRGVPTC